MAGFTISLAELDGPDLPPLRQDNVEFFSRHLTGVADEIARLAKLSQVKATVEMESDLEFNLTFGIIDLSDPAFSLPATPKQIEQARSQLEELGDIIRTLRDWVGPDWGPSCSVCGDLENTLGDSLSGLGGFTLRQIIEKLDDCFDMIPSVVPVIMRRLNLFLNAMSETD